MDKQMHRHEDRAGMFSQCFCDLACHDARVAEMLCQHLSLLDSKKKKKKKKKGREKKTEGGLMRQRGRRKRRMDKGSLKGLTNSNRG